MTGAADWRGAVGDVWAQEWRRTDRSFVNVSPALDAAILAAAPIGPGRALDIGCGAETTSLTLAAVRPDLTVMGIDVSAGLIDTARARAARTGLRNLRFVTADLNAALPDMGRFDLLLSRHGVMFADSPRAMFANLRTVAATGARLIFSCFRASAENPWADELLDQVVSVRAVDSGDYAPGPFGFADPAFVRAVLADAGWQNAQPHPLDYDYIAGAGADPVADAAEFLSRVGPIARAMRDATEPPATIRQRPIAELASRSDGTRVAFPAAAWLWSATT